MYKCLKIHNVEIQSMGMSKCMNCGNKFNDLFVYRYVCYAVMSQSGHRMRRRPGSLEHRLMVWVSAWEYFILDPNPSFEVIL